MVFCSYFNYPQHERYIEECVIEIPKHSSTRTLIIPITYVTLRFIELKKLETSSSRVFGQWDEHNVIKTGN